MGLSYTLRSEPFSPLPGRPTVLVTGAAGNIGSYFSEHAKDAFDLRLAVRETGAEADAIAGFGEVVVADVTELDEFKKICQGVDVLVHLAGDPSPSATWESLLPANITGTYNAFVAAKHAGVRRVVYASSIHAVSGYPADVQIKTSDPVNPGDLYGVTKCFGEALGRYMAEKEGVSVICLRIAAFQPDETALHPDGLYMFDGWVSRRDLHQLMERCVTNTTLQFALFHGLSNNRFKRLDITDARELVGYRPVDNFAESNPLTAPLRLDEKVSAHSRADTAEHSGLRDDLK